MSETQTFFDALHGAKPEGSQILVWTLPEKRSIFCPDVSAAVKAVESVRDSVQGVYAGVAVRDKSYGEKRRGRSEDATGIAGVWADFDVAGPGHTKGNLPPTQAAILDLIDKFGVPPSMSVNTGGGLHVYWLFEEFWAFRSPEDQERAATIVRRWNNTMRVLARSRGWDVDSTFDLSRVLRVPGTTNRKVEGRHLPVHFIEPPNERRYFVEDLEARLIDDDSNAPVAKSNRVYSGVTVGDLKLDPEATIDGVMLTALMDNDPRFKAIWEHKRRDIDTSQSGYDLALANFAVSQLEWTDQQIVDLIICNRRRHGADLKLRADYYQKTIFKARQQERKEGSREVSEFESSTVDPHPFDTERPSVQINDVPLRDQVKLSIGALAIENKRKLGASELRDLLFVRNGRLTRICETVVDNVIRPELERVEKDALKLILSRAADFFQVVKNRTRHQNPPNDVVNSILADRAWSLPVIDAVVETPIVRPDGSIYWQPGYDGITRCYFHPSPEFKMAPVSERPTEDEVREAKRWLLDELLGEFPFADQASRANLVGLLLTPLLRNAITGPVPMALLDKPTSGTGASLLADVGTLIATGRVAGKMSAPTNDDECRKRITSSLMAGHTFIVFDDLDGPLGFSSLDSALTSSVWRDRPLGSNDMIDLPQRATWMATGINIQPIRTMPRRCFLIRIDARMERPEERGFRIPKLLNWTAENRGNILWALLTLARSWYSNGKPSADCPRMSSFEDWRDIIGGILGNAGINDFLANRESLYDSRDTANDEWRTFVAVWHEVIPQHRITARGLARAVSIGSLEDSGVGWDVSKIRNALPSEFAKSSELACDLGLALRKRKGQHFGEFRLDGDGHEHSAVVWKVSRQIGGG